MESTKATQKWWVSIETTESINPRMYSTYLFSTFSHYTSVLTVIEMGILNKKKSDFASLSACKLLLVFFVYNNLLGPLIGKWKQRKWIVIQRIGYRIKWIFVANMCHCYKYLFDFFTIRVFFYQTSIHFCNVRDFVVVFSLHTAEIMQY